MASRCRGRRSPSCPRAASSSPRSRTTAHVHKVTIEITDDAFIVDLRDNPDQVQGPHNASRDGVDHLRADGVQGADRAAGAGERRLLPPAQGADAARLDLRRQGAGGARLLFRGRGAGLRPHAPLPRAAHAGPSAGRQLRLDLRHGDRRPASRTPAGISPSSSRRSAAGAANVAATATRRSSRASTARPSTARPKSPSRATASMSTRRRSTRRTAARAAGAAARASASTIASAPTARG